MDLSSHDVTCYGDLLIFALVSLCDPHLPITYATAYALQFTKFTCGTCMSRGLPPDGRCISSKYFPGTLIYPIDKQQQLT